jgi:hypothetical protein
MGKEAAAPTAAKFYASNAVSIDSSNPNIGTFDVPVGDNGFVDPGTSGAYVFYGIYPYKAIEATASAAPSLTVSLPSTQTPASSSFDAAGDIMVGKTVVMGGFPSTPVEISWSRIVAHLDLTFKNLSSVSGYTEGETVSSIKLTTNSEAPIAGSFTLDITNNNISGASSNEILISG